MKKDFLTTLLNVEDINKMPKTELLEYIKANATHDHKEILDKAKAEADTIIEESTRSSEDLRNQARMKVQAEAGRLRERRYNTIRFGINARRYELKSSAIESIWREAEEILQKIEKSEKYKDILGTLFYECLNDVPDGSIVRAFPADAGIVKACIERSKHSLVFEEDPHVHGGVEFHWPDGKTALKNTLSHRLSRLKAEGNAEFSRILFSFDEDSAP